MPRAGLSSEAIVEIAVEIVDAKGPHALTLAAVAERAGVAAPSLYKHVPSLAALHALVSAYVINEIAERTSRAALGRSRDDALRSVMLELRSYATEHPLRYQAMRQSADATEQEAAATERLLRVIFAVLRGYGLDGPDLIHATRCVRAAVHGFAVLQAADGFGLSENLDTSYELLTQMVTAGLRAPSV